MPAPATSARRPAGRCAAALSASILAGCATVRIADAPATDTRPAVREVAITRTAQLPGPPDRVFAAITAEDVLPKVLTGYGPLPAVVGTSAQTGPWDQPGAERVVHLADGTTLREQVTMHEAPVRFGYRVWEFGHPVIRTLATGGRGAWTFTPADGGTQVTWTYTFTARSALSAVPLTALVQVLWRGYMDVCLRNAAARLAAPDASS